MDKLLLTPEDAARALSIGRSKLYELLATGALRSVRIGTSRRIPVETLAAYVHRLTGPDSSVHEPLESGCAQDPPAGSTPPGAAGTLATAG